MPESSPIPAPLPWLHRVLAAGYLRYLIIAGWGLALATEVRPSWVAAWFTVTILSGVARSIVDRRETAREKPRRWVMVTIATLSCVTWAAAPLLAWFDGGAYGPVLAAVLLFAGYVLVFTQMRSAVREALIVSIPYGAVTLLILGELWGRPAFLTLLACIPLAGLTMLIKVVVTSMKDAQINDALARQAILIGELESARDQANAASDAKSYFLGVISHELRTPMNGVLGAAQLLEAMEMAPRQREFVSVIRNSGESLLSLLNDILDMTKIEAGRMDLAPESVTFEQFRTRAIGPFQAQAEAKGLEFRCDVAGDIPARIELDSLRVGQIVQNLLSNAVKFTDSGCVTLTIECHRRDDGHGDLTLGISDTGAGIAPQDIQRLFQPFSQVDESATRRFGGTGLGLTIARRLAQLMDGDLTVDSRLGSGSTFALAIPVKVDCWNTTTEAARDGLAPGSEDVRRTVLVVEDHPVNRMILEAWLGSLGHDSTCAGNGQEALDLAATAPFDLIVMDVNMPVMDGLTATRALRDHDGPNRDTPIVVLSASARPEDHAVGFAAGADAYVNKPVDFVALAAILRACGAGREAVSAVASPERRAA